MSVDHIRYDLLTQDALRSVIRKVLTDVAANGLPGEHHFYITFDTRVDGVRMSARLKASYPDEMTIVLQHQFWELTVGEDDFDVGLAFNRIPERLHIPFNAVKAFIDPSVQFALEFAVRREAPKETSGEVTTETHAATMKPAPGPKPLPAKLASPATPPKPRLKKEGARPATPAAKPAPPPLSGKDDSAGEVVRLDNFRKK